MDLQKDFHKYNLITGWGVFLIALLTYGLSVEPTVSFWDCGEYISTSAKLQVGHPPGAPFFQMVGAFFATFAPSSDKISPFCELCFGIFECFYYFIFIFYYCKSYKKGSKAKCTGAFKGRNDCYFGKWSSRRLGLYFF